MENLEVILTNFKKEELNKFVLEELSLSDLNIKSSHFYDSNSGQNIEFHQVKSIIDVLSPIGTGNMVIKYLEFGIIMKNIVIVFSFDEKLGDIVFNFPESNVFVDDKGITYSHCRKLLNYLVELKEKYSIPSIRFGYEPASDDDMCLININDDKTNIANALEKIII
ncbi:hypothetical protein [Paenibacillus sp. GXUN7292]|uniref:hypothetical protein n=1 Tax=Paenibacillus sp. GXUN7292 TaxID=3422499 RepID=UPI003D7D836F